MQPNFRGSAGYGQAFLEAGRGEWASAIQDDLADTVHDLVARSLVNDQEVCIAGFSFGGYSALVSSARYPELYKCAISGSPVTSVRDMLDHVDDRDPDALSYWEELIGVPRRDEQGLQSISPVHMADRINIPVFLFHGTHDSVVPIEQSHQMADVFDAAGSAYYYLEVAGMGHDWSHVIGTRQVIYDIGAFLDHALDGRFDTFEAIGLDN